MSSSAPAGRLFAGVEREREAIFALFAAHHAARPRIFGSVARGDDEPGSDIDVLVDFDDGASLLDEVGLRLALQDLLQCEVDVGCDQLRGARRQHVLSEAMPI